MRDRAFLVATSAGVVARYRPGEEATVFATGLDQVAGLAIANDNDVLVAESSTGRVLQIRDGNITVVASDLGRPMGIACESDGRLTIADAKYGRILRIHNGDTRTLVTGLREPHGLAIHGANYFVVDRAAKTLLQISREDAVVSVIASNLPIAHRRVRNQRVLPGTETVARATHSLLRTCGSS